MLMTLRRTALLPLTLHFLSVAANDAAVFGRICAPGFVSSPSLRTLPAESPLPLPPAALHLSNGKDESRQDYHFGGDGITRREVLLSTALIGAAASLVKPRSALSVTSTAIKKPLPSSVTSSTLCDPSVSTWVKKYDDQLRTVHILGTAHISSSSAELAGQLVRDLKPSVVFVELDAKRVARALPGGIQSSGGMSFGTDPVSGTIASSGGAGEDISLITQGKVATSAITSTPSDARDSQKKSNPFDVRTKLVDAGSKYLGGAVKGMYGKLESEGFKAGDEFAMSVREGLAIGSTIVLGDRDVEVTLQRLTRALAKTDIRKLLSVDSEMNSSMEEVLPEGMRNQLKQTSGASSRGARNSIGVMGMGTEDIMIDRGEFQTFLETMKAKENTKKIMGALRSTAPEIYEAMVAERDVYMARGLDELGENLKGICVDDTVAVMGMAHVDGVETYLASRGWKEMPYPCPVKK